MHYELPALAEHCSTDPAPPATDWKGPGEEAGPAATLEPGGGKIAPVVAMVVTLGTISTEGRPRLLARPAFITGVFV